MRASNGKFGQFCGFLRGFVTFLLGGMVVSHSRGEVDRRVRALPLYDQVSIILGCLMGLAMASAVFSHAGIGGVAAFWAALIYVVR